MEDMVENEQIQWIREMLVEWLANDAWEPQQLIDWLQSYGLPVDSQEEPFLWLLRSLPPGDELYAAKRKLASRAAEVLSGKPDETRPGDEPNKVLLNLFYFCAGLGCADELAEPLYGVYERQKLKGEWSGIDLRDSLRAALTANQIDARLESVWLRMVRGQRGFLTGDPEDGIDGVRLIPPSATQRGEPSLDAIGSALKIFAERLMQEHDRRKQLSSVMNTITETYPGYPSWDIDLLQQAHKYQWPTWAVECLPSLYILREPSLHGDRAIIWHYVLACVPGSLKYQVRSELCGGLVLDVEMAEDTSAFVHLIASTFEGARLSNPYSSDRSVVGVVAGAMSQAELSAIGQNGNEAIVAIRKARRRILGRAGVEPDFDALGEAIQEIAGWRESDRTMKDRVRILVKAASGIYPSLDLMRQAEERHWSPAALALLKRVA